MVIQSQYTKQIIEQIMQASPRNLVNHRQIIQRNWELNLRMQKEHSANPADKMPTAKPQGH